MRGDLKRRHRRPRDDMERASGASATGATDQPWRVPQRRQKRAFADSDRPHVTQDWTPTGRPASGTGAERMSRLDTSQTGDSRDRAAATRAAHGVLGMGSVARRPASVGAPQVAGPGWVGSVPSGAIILQVGWATWSAGGGTGSAAAGSAASGLAASGSAARPLSTVGVASCWSAAPGSAASGSASFCRARRERLGRVRIGRLRLRGLRFGDPQRARRGDLRNRGPGVTGRGLGFRRVDGCHTGSRSATSPSFLRAGTGLAVVASSRRGGSASAAAWSRLGLRRGVPPGRQASHRQGWARRSRSGPIEARHAPARRSRAVPSDSPRAGRRDGPAHHGLRSARRGSAQGRSRGSSAPPSAAPGELSASSAELARAAWTVGREGTSVRAGTRVGRRSEVGHAGASVLS